MINSFLFFTLFLLSIIYNDNGDNMTIYIDIVFIINYFFDFILLLSLSILLKRKVKLINIMLGSFIGSLSLIFLFIDTNNIELFIYKLIISILMNITTFGYKSIKYTIKNVMYFYFISIFLGGFLYIINNSFNYHNGLVFYHNGLSINIILIIIITPILLFIYLKNIKNIKNNYNNYYNLSIYVGNNIINVTSYLDTGNKLVSPYSNKPIILLRNKSPVFDKLKYTLVPYNTIDNNGFIKCYKVDSVLIEGVGSTKNVLIGIINHNINMDGVDAILNVDILEGI